MAFNLSHRKQLNAAIAAAAFVMLSACSDGAKPVTVAKAPGSTAASADGAAFKLSVFSPQAPDPSPTREFTAPLGADITLGLKAEGIDPANASVGYISTLSGISLTTSQLTIRAPREGDFKVTIYLRDMAKCKAQTKDAVFCDLKGKAVRSDRQSFDAVESILISVIDPSTLGGDPSKNCQGGSGMFDDIMCKRGLVGTLVNALMPGGIGSMVGGLGGGAAGGAGLPGATTTGAQTGANTQPPIGP